MTEGRRLTVWQVGGDGPWNPAPSHECGKPEALSHEAEEWSCPGCGKRYERHWDAWWQEAES